MFTNLKCCWSIHRLQDLWLRYTFDLVFRELMGIDYKITHPQDEFIFTPEQNWIIVKLNWKWIVYLCHGFLLQRGIRDQQPAIFDWMDKGIFATHPKFILPFDPFSCTFYMVSRYEEYLPHKRDEHDGFDAHGGKRVFYTNLWSIFMQVSSIEILIQHFPDLKFPERKISLYINNRYRQCLGTPWKKGLCVQRRFTQKSVPI